MMCLSVVILLIGMLAGIAMGIQQNFTLAPAHAHLNLIGGVLLFLFGLFYRLVPAAGATTLAKVQGWIHMIGAIVFLPALRSCSQRAHPLKRRRSRDR
jgi:heme/copper-type cytochrome/quinol oxidase subunit 1